MMSTKDTSSVSIVIPAFNEGEGVAAVVLRLREEMKKAQIEAEIIVVDDGSADDTAAKAKEAGATVIRNPSNKGYGFSLRRGIEAARHNLIAITDADDTYPAEALPTLIREAEDFDMVVGARTGRFYDGNPVKRLSRIVFRWLSEWAAGNRIPDINSGLRVLRRDFVLSVKRFLPNGYSFTTTITLLAFLEAKHLKYIPIQYHQRIGRSKVKIVRDSLRSLQIITEAILHYNPMKFFLLLTFLPILIGLGMTISGLAVFANLIHPVPALIINTMGFAAMLSVLIGALGCLATMIKSYLRPDSSRPT